MLSFSRGCCSLEFRVYSIAWAVQLRVACGLGCRWREIIIAHLLESSGLQLLAFGYSFWDLVSLMAKVVVLFQG